MTLFWMLAALLLVCALAFIILPLKRARGAAAGVTRDDINVSVHRDQMRELDADLAAGTITQERYDEAVREIERRLLEDTGARPNDPRRHAGAGRSALVAGIAVPVLAAGIYWLVGTPEALTPGPGAASPHAQGMDARDFEAMVDKLAARLQANPDDPKGWVMLARSYMVLQKFPEAVRAYATAADRNPNDAQLLADYADALAMTQGSKLEGEPEKLIAKALAIEPDNVKALALAGTAAFHRRDYATALKHWERIVQVAPPGSELAQAVQSSVEEARALAGIGGKPSAVAAAPAAPPSPPNAQQSAAGASVSGVVQLAPELASKVAPTDTLFVFARAAEGPRAPVAILRAQAKDLPLQFTLDDRSALMSGAKLSDQKLVIVGARISKSGSAMAQPGDVQGYSPPVAPGTSNLRIVVSELAK